jgi:hypothetical protein
VKHDGIGPFRACCSVSLGAIVLIYLADRGELPVVERSVRHHHRAAGGPGRASCGCCSPPAHHASPCRR